MLLSAQGLSVLAANRLRSQVPSGMTQRFCARARSEGIGIHFVAVPEPAQRFLGVRFAVACAFGLAILAAGLIAIWDYGHLHQVEQHAKVSPSSPILVPRIETPSGDENHLQEQLATARSEINSMSTAMKGQRNEIELANRSTTSLRSDLNEMEERASVLQAEQANRESRIKQLEEELQKSRSEGNANDIVATLQETELRELRKQVADQAGEIRQQEALAQRGSDVRDLVVARNLHIIDVHDRDGDGKSQRAFGRIFYAEGKSLTFYAYDLADQRKLDAKVSFYVWGERLGTETPVRNLGIFHSDDVTDGRWILTFDDARVLTQIDSVFVTAESSRKIVREPRGQRRLFAFLGGNPNHP